MLVVTHSEFPQTKIVPLSGTLGNTGYNINTHIELYQGIRTNDTIRIAIARGQIAFTKLRTLPLHIIHRVLTTTTKNGRLWLGSLLGYSTSSYTHSIQLHISGSWPGGAPLQQGRG